MADELLSNVRKPYCIILAGAASIHHAVPVPALPGAGMRRSSAFARKRGREGMG